MESEIDVVEMLSHDRVQDTEPAEEILRRLLSSRLYEDRVRALTAFGEFDRRVILGQRFDHEAVRLLSDPHPEVRIAAIDALVTMGEACMSHVDKVIERFDDSEKAVRQAAVAAVGVLGEGKSKRHRVIEALVLCLDLVDEPFTQQCALASLGALKAAHSAEAVAALLRSPKSSVRLAALETLANMRQSPDAVAALLDSNDDEDRNMALIVLGTMEEQAAPYVPMAAEALKDSVTRNFALAMLGKMGEAATPYIFEICGFLLDPDAETREVAVTTLARLRKYVEVSAVDAVAELIKARIPHFRAVGATTLGLLGAERAGEYAHAIAELLTDPAPGHCSDDVAVPSLWKPNCAAAFALSVLGERGHAFAASLATHLQSNDFLFRIQVMEALGEMSEKGAIQADALAACLSDPDPVIRLKALEQLGKLGKTRNGLSYDVMEKVAAIIADKMEHRDLRSWAMHSLGACGGKAAPFTGVLGQLLKSEDLELVIDALTTVGAIGKTTVKEFNAVTEVAAGLLEHPRAAIRLAAVMSLGDTGADAHANLVALRLEDYTDIRCAAAIALSKMGSEGLRHSEAIVDLLEDALPTVRQSACQSLGNFAEAGMPLPKIVVAMLKDAAADEFEWVGQEATTALDRIRRARALCAQY